MAATEWSIAQGKCGSAKIFNPYVWVSAHCGAVATYLVTWWMPKCYK